MPFLSLVLAVAQATSTEITFAGAGGIELKGTLLRPEAAAKPVPAVLLLPGSGPTDRDGNQLPALRTDLLKSVAEDLAAAGIATFRFDKRACAASRSTWPTAAEEFGPFFSWENHLGDATGAFKAMQSAEGIDPGRCAVLGHSEGGLITLGISGSVEPAAVVLAGAPGRPLWTVLREQLAAQFPRALGEEAAAKLLEANDRIALAIQETGQIPGDVPDVLRPLYNDSVAVYLRQSFGLDPAALARAMKAPTLVVNGSRDVQISPERDAGPLYEALAARPNGVQRKHIVEDASHNFKPVRSDTDPGFAGPPSSDFLAAVRSFLTETLKP